MDKNPYILDIKLPDYLQSQQKFDAFLLQMHGNGVALPVIEMKEVK